MTEGSFSVGSGLLSTVSADAGISFLTSGALRRRDLLR